MATGEFVRFRVGEVHLAPALLGEDFTGFSVSASGLVRVVAAYGRRSDGLRIGALRSTGDEFGYYTFNTTLSAESPDPQGITPGGDRLFDAIEAGVESRSPQTIMINAGSGNLSEVLPVLSAELADLADRIDSISA